ncbi:MAG: Gx transporter family protein [Mariprofundaceae bacterium]|nr:Gx transporter family protein [Mariprofundaceae bacterium]
MTFFASGASRPTGPSNALLLARPSLEELQGKAQWMALLMLAVGIHVLESALPGLGPWFKPGLANIITLVALVMLGPRQALMLAVARVIIGAMFIGTLFTPTFIMSLSGALAAALIMLAVWRLIPGISLIGVSLLGALAHMLVQIITVEALFIQQSALFYLLPPFLLVAVLTGWLNGVAATYIVERLQREDHPGNAQDTGNAQEAGSTPDTAHA